MSYTERLIGQNKVPQYSEELKPVLEKIDESEMPVFSQEVPIESKMKQTDGTVSIKYFWKQHSTASEVDSIKIKNIVYREGQQLGYFYKISTRDGYDSISVKYNGITYFLRKTTEEVARALYNAAVKIKGSVENIVGYLATVLGNFYTISVIERGSWTFDKKLASDQVNLAEVEKFDTPHREKLVELIVENLISLHKKRLVLGKFGLENIMLTTKNVFFTDLRNMRVSRKSPLFVDEFLFAIKYLLATGIARRSDIVHATVAYSVAMQDACNQWYLEKNGRAAKDEMDTISEMENEVENC